MSSDLNPRRHLLLNAAKLFYLGLLGLSFGVTTAVVVSQGHGPLTLRQFLSMRIKLENFVLFALIVLAWHVVLSACGFYESTRLAPMRALLAETAKATTAATLVVAVAAWPFKVAMATPLFLIQFWLLSSVIVILARVGVRYALGKIRIHGRNLRQVLILGTNTRAIEFARRIESDPELGFRVLGFADDDWAGQQSFIEARQSLCCNLTGLADYFRQNVVDEVVVYLPFRTYYEHSCQVAALCEQHGILMRIAPDIFNLKIARPYTDEFDGSPHIIVQSGVGNGWPVLLKRFLDVILSVCLLVLLAPLFLVVAAGIKLTSTGPAFYRQERVGLNKRRFWMYKFRSMVANAERLLPELELMNEVAGPVFKMKNDPRMTPIGRFLRRASIDELPQLFNVLRGDMSLVGPRPLPVRDFQGFSEDWQRRRFSIRPGLTCLWQVHGRSTTSFEKWMQLDLQYIDEWSLLLDLKILLLTIPAVLRGVGAT